ncbi:MAG: hypothetical protein IJN61_05930 [Clostridia bacterium]|nr:hypothetical protein [Clostridia bacterium]
MIQARIAGLPIQFDGGDREFFTARLRQYEASVDKPELSMKLLRVPEIVVPVGEEIARHGGLVIVRSPNGEVCRYTIGNKTGRILQISRSSQDHSRFEFTLLESRKHPALSLTDFEYLHTGEAFANRLAYLGGLVMHGSAISYEGKGIVFSAPSGTGKSTHAGLWKQQYGERVVHINDDKPAIRFNEESPVVYGTPWSGKTDTNSNNSAPLKAIVFLEQASENQIQPLSVDDALMHIYRETVRPFYDEALGMKVLEAAERLIQSIPVFLLKCTISSQAVELVKNTMQW